MYFLSFYKRPVFISLVVSLLLSFAAYLGAVTIGKDGAFYVDIAQTIVDYGIGAGVQRFNWIGFPAILAGLHLLTGLPIEGLAYLLCALFMAGTCSLLVDLVKQQTPQAAWWAVLVVLSIPAFNAFRSDIIREHGFWFFSVLTLWLAYQWQDRRSWWLACAVQFSILFAVLFRLEAVLLEVALLFWRLPSLRFRSGWVGVLQLFYIPLVAGLMAIWVVSTLSSSRVSYFLSMINPAQVISDFKQVSDQFSDSLKYKWSKDDAWIIVLFGVASLILFKFLKLGGFYSLSVLFPKVWREARCDFSKFYLNLVVALLYFLVLFVFFFHEQFLNSRYQAFMNLALVPFFVLMVFSFIKIFPKLKSTVLVLSVLLMIANVVSISAKKTHYIEAGHWLAEHAKKTDVIYYDDPRIGYYAGFGYRTSEILQEALSLPGKYRYLVVEADGDESWLIEFISRNNIKILADFRNRKNSSVLVLGR